MNVSKKDIQLSSGDVITVGMNFYTLQLLSQYPGGFNKLMESLNSLDESDGDNLNSFTVAMDALTYMLYCMVRSSGVQCTPESCAMMISIEDSEILLQCFQDFTAAMEKMLPADAGSSLRPNV